MGDRPKLTKEEKAARSAAWQKRREAAAARREEMARTRQNADKRPAAIREAASKRLVSRQPAPPPVARVKTRGKKDRRTPLQKKMDQRKSANREAWAKAHPARAREEQAMKKARAAMLDRWDHKNDGTPETHQKHADRERHYQGALARLHRSGAIDDDQLAYAHEIASVAERIEADVTVRTASLETRVDRSSRCGGDLERNIVRVWMEMAYTRWRMMLPLPRQAVLDMIVGDAIGYSVAARRYGMRASKAKKMLIDALDRWPECFAWARKQVNAAELLAYNAGLG